MSRRIFRSKIDSWLLVLLIAAVVLEIGVTVFAAMELADPWTATGTVFAGLAVVAFIASIVFRTYYAVDRGQLIITTGPFRWRIPIDEIHAVEPTKNPLSSPALSLDRLRLTYGNHRHIMVSPADKAGFLKAIGHGAERRGCNDER